MIIEGFRTDSLYISGTNIRVSQLFSAVLATVCLVLFIYFTVKYTKHPKPIEGVDYFPPDAVLTRKERKQQEAASAAKAAAETEQTSSDTAASVAVEDAPQENEQENTEENTEEI